tara:strand:- start:54 stop:830 length:777 start_codon:yes stop_codon:yes gene_type:complete
MKNLCLFVFSKTYQIDGSHDIQHVRSVVHNVATVLRAKYGDANAPGTQHIRRLSEAAAWVHDVCDRKYAGKIQCSVKELYALLLRTLDQPDACLVFEAASHVSFSRLRRLGAPQLPLLSSIVWRIVSEADMLEAMGVTGMIRTMMYQGAVHKTVDDALSYADNVLTQRVYCIKYSKKEAYVRLSRMRHLIHAASHTGHPHHTEILSFMRTCHAFGRRGLSFSHTLHHVLTQSVSTRTVRRALRDEQRVLCPQLCRICY